MPDVSPRPCGIVVRRRLRSSSVLAAWLWARLFEYLKHKLKLLAVCPGVIRTPMIEALVGTEAEAGLIAMEPIGRMGKPEEVAEAVVWLCSDAASFVTGNAMPVDGGLVAQ